MLVCFHLEYGQVVVGFRYSTLISAQCIGCDHVASSRPHCVASAVDLGLLKDPQVHVDMRHPMQGGLQAAIVPILDVI